MSSKEYSVIETVPAADRHYGFADMVATWIGANANTGSWYIGGVAGDSLYHPVALRYVQRRGPSL